MRRFLTATKCLAWMLAGFLLAGCSSTDDSQVNASVYYGAGFNDPWYYGGYYDDIDVIVTPPDRPDSPPKPTHPIAPTPAPRPMPMPSIPRTPMPMPRVRVR